jgi:hypothetical protein
MLRRVDPVWTYISEERIASIFGVDTSESEEPAWAGGYKLQIFPSWRWRRYVPPKRGFTKDLHGITSQKMAFLIVIAVKTLNLTQRVNAYISRDHFIPHSIQLLLARHHVSLSIDGIFNPLKTEFLLNNI